MAISPYSTARPVNFEYKPMGLEAFAKPLSAMQEKYDKASEDLEKLPKLFNSLPIDDPRRTEIEKSIQEANDRVKEEFLKTGNYKQAQRDILALQKKFTTDPEKLHLEEQLKKELAIDKALRERLDKGEYSKEDYIKDKNLRMKDYEVAGGANWKSETEKNSIKDRMMVKDQSKEISELAFKLMNATPTQKRNYLGNYKAVDGTVFTKQAIDQMIEEKNTWNSVDNVMAIIKQDSQFSSYFNDRSDLNLRTLKYDKDRYSETSKELLTNTTNALEKEIEKVQKSKKPEDKKFVESEAFKNAQQRLEEYKSMISGSKPIDENIVDNLYNQRFVNEQLGIVNQYADLLYDKDITKSRSNMTYRAYDLGLENDGKGNLFVPSIGLNPLTDTSILPETIEQQKINSTQNSKSFTQQLKTNGQANILINNQHWYNGRNKDYLYRINSDGTVEAKHKQKGNVFTLKQNDADNVKDNILENISKNPDRVFQRTNSVIKAYDKNINNVEGFVKELKKIGVSDADARKQFKTLQNKDTYRTIETNLQQLEQDATNYNLANEADKLLNEKLKQSPAYQELNNIIKNTLQGKVSESTLYYSNQYPAEKIKKLGIPIDKNYLLTGEQVAKLNGFSSFTEAYNKGFFNQVLLEGATTKTFNIDKQIYEDLGIDNPLSLWGRTGATIGSLKKSIKSAYAKTGQAQLQMTYTIDGDEKLNKRITQLAPSTYVAGTFDPVLGSWDKHIDKEGNPFFDEKGNPEKGVIRDEKADRVGVIPFANQAGLILGYKNKDTGATISVMVKPKKGTSTNVNTTYGAIIETAAQSKNKDVANGFRAVQYKNMNPTGVLIERDVQLLANNKDSKGRLKPTTISSIPFLDKGELVIKASPNTNNDFSKPVYNIYLKSLDGTETIISDTRTESLTAAQIKSVNIAKSYTP
jgi:hypothetical protein